MRVICTGIYLCLLQDGVILMHICRTIVIIVVWLLVKPMLLENKILCTLFIGVYTSVLYIRASFNIFLFVFNFNIYFFII